MSHRKDNYTSPPGGSLGGMGRKMPTHTQPFPGFCPAAGVVPGVFDASLAQQAALIFVVSDGAADVAAGGRRAKNLSPIVAVRPCILLREAAQFAFRSAGFRTAGAISRAASAASSAVARCR